MTSWQDTIIIAAGMLHQLFGESFINNPTATPVAIWPQSGSTGVKANYLWLRAQADFHMAVVPAVDTAGPHSARFAASQEYIFPLHPTLSTLFFLDAASSSNRIDLRWIAGR